MNAIRSIYRFTIIVSFTFVNLSCNNSTTTEANQSKTFLFGMNYENSEQENFIAITSDQEVIKTLENQLLLPPDQRVLHINGKIARGDGGHNFDWSWHFVENEWTMVEFSIELCDGRASLVEEDIDYWVDTVGRFCPWFAYVIEEL